MRLAKKSRTLLPLAFSAVLATCALAQDHPNIQPSAVRDIIFGLVVLSAVLAMRERNA